MNTTTTPATTIEPCLAAASRRRARLGAAALAVVTATAGATTLPAGAQSAAAGVVRSAAGKDAAAITTAVEAFRTDLGGGTVAGANGIFGGVRREINWDAVPENFSSPNDLPFDFFNTRSPRGVVFSTPGVSVQVSARRGSTVAPPLLANVNPDYLKDFQAFSQEKIFGVFGSTTTEVDFFVAGTTNPARVKGFGVVLTDVDTPDLTKLELLDAQGKVLASQFAQPFPGAGSFSFVGISLERADVARVRIVTGGTHLGTKDADASGSRDKVAMDDFIYSEPVAAPAPTPSSVTTPVTVPATTATTRAAAAPTTKATTKATTKRTTKATTRRTTTTKKR